MSIRTMLCRLGLRHHWVAHTTEDGSRYMRCSHCGRDKGTPEAAPSDRLPPIA